MSLSIAIPTFNSSKYLEELLNQAYKIQKVTEIVIQDDASDESDFRLIKETVKNFKKYSDVEIKLNRNDVNLGGFKNKYLAVKKCKNDTIYQIDSDNVISNSTIKYLNKKDLSKLNKNHLYVPGYIYVFKKNYQITKLKRSTHNKLTDSKLEIRFEDINENIKNNNITPKSIDWVLNLGNWIFDKSSYLEKLYQGFKSDKYPLEACSIAGAYFWLVNNGSLMIDNKLRHHHRLRPDSYYVMEKENAPKSVNFFLEKFKDHD